MKYDFDTVISRRNTGALKYDFAVERGKPADILPLWVADMDFATPIEVSNKLVEIARHGIFGYSESKGPYFEAVHQWFSRRFGYHSEEAWLIKAPGVVFALSCAIRAYTETGDAILIQQPVYPPFASMVNANERTLVVNELVLDNGHYRIDFDDFEQKLIKHRARLFILCSPHNPVGRVWTKEELRTMGALCLKHRCLIVADEIHCDFTYPGYRHHVLATLAPEIAENTILCTAPSKTFNLAGLQASNIFIQNLALRQKFIRQMDSSGYSQLNTMGIAACEYAYRYGEDWLTQLRDYLAGNRDYLRHAIGTRLPEIRMIEPEGTYLVWLDFRALGMQAAQLDHWVTHQAKLWLNGGASFGTGGEGFMRINIGCPRALLREAVDRLEQALHTLLARKNQKEKL